MLNAANNSTIQIVALPELAERIRIEMRAGIEHAARAGALLNDAKAHVPHGQWLPWLRENFGLSERSAQNYMRLSRTMTALPKDKAQRVADLPLREAMAALAAPRSRWQPGTDGAIGHGSDGMKIYVAPSLDHPGFFFIVRIDDLSNGGEAVVESLKRPIRHDYLETAISVLSRGQSLEWDHGACGAWTTNPFMAEALQ